MTTFANVAYPHTVYRALCSSKGTNGQKSDFAVQRRDPHAALQAREK